MDVFKPKIAKKRETEESQIYAGMFIIIIIIIIIIKKIYYKVKL